MNMYILRMFEGTFSLDGGHINSMQEKESIMCVGRRVKAKRCRRWRPGHQNSLQLLTLILLKPDMPCLYRQCRPR